jgi:predicted O-methyltransferase YrrM
MYPSKCVSMSQFFDSLENQRDAGSMRQRWRNMQIVKQLIKSLVPRPILNRALATNDWLRLVTLPQKAFDPCNLRAADTLRLADVFGNKQIAAAWERDLSIINSLYGNEDKLEGVNPGDRRALYYLVMALKPQNVLEVGTHIGASTLHIARALKRLNQNGRMTSVDIIDVNHPKGGPWKHLGLSKSPMDFARQLECLEHIDFQTGACLDLMHTTRQRFDFIFLDGDHSARSVYREVSAALSLLETNGVILLHDYYPGATPLYRDRATISGPFHALERIQNENPAIGVLPLGDLPWPTKQGRKVTSLALVARSDESASLPSQTQGRQESQMRTASLPNAGPILVVSGAKVSGEAS